MHRERLELLMKRLELEQSKLSPMENFEMGHWASLNATIQEGVFEPSCGTSACAAGLATTVPELRAAGFYLCHEGRYPVVRFKDPAFDANLSGVSACARFFGLSYVDANELFEPAYYPTAIVYPIQVADRIRELLAKS